MNLRFNLQPWREQRRKAEQQRFIALTAVILLGAVALMGFNYYLEKNYLESQESAKEYLNNEITKLKAAETKVKETKLLIEEIGKQITSIEALESRRGIALKLLDRLASVTPDSVFLEHVSLQDQKLTVQGVAKNDSAIADFMRALPREGLVKKPVLQGIESAKSTERFTVPDDAEIKSFTVVAELDI